MRPTITRAALCLAVWLTATPHATADFVASPDGRLHGLPQGPWPWEWRADAAAPAVSPVDLAVGAYRQLVPGQTGFCLAGWLYAEQRAGGVPSDPSGVASPADAVRLAPFSGVGGPPAGPAGAGAGGLTGRGLSGATSGGPWATAAAGPASEPPAGVPAGETPPPPPSISPLARQAVRTVSGVQKTVGDPAQALAPEPSGWVLCLTFLAATGCFGRRRRRNGV